MAEFNTRDAFGGALCHTSQRMQARIKSDHDAAMRLSFSWMHGRLALLLEPMHGAHFSYHIHRTSDGVLVSYSDSGIDDRTKRILRKSSRPRVTRAKVGAKVGKGIQN